VLSASIVIVQPIVAAEHRENLVGRQRPQDAADHSPVEPVMSRRHRRMRREDGAISDSTEVPLPRASLHAQQLERGQCRVAFVQVPRPDA
jgi:hypothetical protein